MAVQNHPDRPKLLADTLARAHRCSQLADPHMAALTDFVAALRSEVGDQLSVPDFDPWDGGISADVLFLLEAPGAKAVASGFISRNNPDETAKNFFELNREAGLPRDRTITWNVVPWYIGSGTKIHPAKRADVARGIEPLQRLLALLPRLQVVVLVGKAAQRATEMVHRCAPSARIFASPHPSPLFVNHRAGNRDRILTVLREVATYLKDLDAAV